MTLPRLALVCSLSVVLLPACQGKKAAPAGQGSPASQPAAGAPTPTPTPAADGATPTATPTAAEAPPDAPAADGSALGADRADPSWFRKTMFGDKGKAIDTKRSAADDQGRFSSLIRFELTDMTVDQCAEHLQALVSKDLTNLQREAKPQGRIQLTGSTDAFTATLVCGEAQGKTIAYVSYSWT